MIDSMGSLHHTLGSYSKPSFIHITKSRVLLIATSIKKPCIALGFLEHLELSLFQLLFVSSIQSKTLNNIIGHRTMPSPSPIHSLPEELLDRIAYFSPPPSLHALSLTSRTLNRIATPHLYTSITLTRESFKFLRPLTLLLWMSPKHRSLVRRISVSRAYGGNLVPWPKYEGLDELVEEQVGRYVKEGEREGWVRQVRDGGDVLAIASLLLRGLPNVGRMGFDGFELVDPGREGMDGEAC
jgi:hypothetical protein